MGRFVIISKRYQIFREVTTLVMLCSLIAGLALMLVNTATAAKTLEGVNLNLEDDLFYYTSFADVSQWAKIYKTCDINFNFQYNRTEIDEEALRDGPSPEPPLVREVYSLDNIPHNLSPISITHSTVKDLTASKDDKKRNKLVVLKIFNPLPPKLGSYAVSFGFQPNKECVVMDYFAPCLLSKTFGKVRGVVLTAQRPSVREIREQFTVEDPDEFPSLLFDGSEGRFYEAIFMGTREKLDCQGTRSTHVIDGKCYPMEIYLYFVDETVPAMASTTILVVLVEEGKQENLQVRPVSNAVGLHLYQKERTFLRQHKEAIHRERAFHHMGATAVVREMFDYKFRIPPSLQAEQLMANQRDHFERVQAYKTAQRFLYEDHTKVKETLQTISIPPKIPGDPPPPNYVELVVKQNVIDFVYYTSANLQKKFYNERDKNKPGYVPIPITPVVIPPDFPSFLPEAIESWCIKAQQLAGPSFISANRGKKDTQSKLDTLTIIRNGTSQATEAFAAAYGALENFIKNQTGLPDIWDPETFQEVLVEAVENGLQGVRTQNARSQSGFKSMQEVYIKQGFPTKDPADPNKTLNFISLFEDDYVDTEIRIIFDEDYDRDHLQKFHKLKKIEKSTYEDFDTGTSFFLGNLEMPREEFEEQDKRKPIQHILQHKFQVSWLLPKGGGYYKYKGSSPVPPCFGAKQVIVFKKPIKLSKEQIEVLSVVPTSNLKTRDLINTLGVRNPLRTSKNLDAQTIYFDKRNHQFMGDDGHHKNSILEFEKRKKAGKGAASSRGNVFMILLLSLFIMLV